MRGMRLIMMAMGFGAMAAPAWALSTYDAFDGEGNDCRDINSLETCSINGSPGIVKFNYGVVEGSFVITSTEINSSFTTITGDEFEVFFDVFSDDGEGLSGTWQYTPDDDVDPGVTAFATKAGSGFTLFIKDGPAFAGVGDSAEWFTNGQGLSHITFFDTQVPPPPPITETPVPVPAALPLAATAMFGLGWFARRWRKAA